MEGGVRSSDSLEVGKKSLKLVNTLFQGFVGSQAEGQSPYSDINLLLDRILQCNVSVENSRKVTVDELRMKPALFSVFCEIKERTSLNYNQQDMEDPPDPQLMRLDNMLIAEGVAGKNNQGVSTTPEVTIQNSEYKAKLVQIRYELKIYIHYPETFGCNIFFSGTCTTRSWRSMTRAAKSLRHM